MLALESGRFMTTLTNADGHRTILSIGATGDLLGELSVLDGLRRIASCVAIEECVVHAVPADAFLRFARANDLIEILLRHSISRLREAQALRHGLMTDRVSERLLQALERLGPPESGSFRVNLTQSELAELVGASRNAVGAALRSWIANNWVASHPVRGLVVKDLVAVRRHEQASAEM